jgi:hypothetical protein
MINQYNQKYHKTLTYLEESKSDLEIYKYLPFNFFLQILLTKKIIIKGVQNWEDEYENFLTKVILEYKNGEKTSLYHFMPSFYGQCWTKLRESDAMWRIYSINNLGVRIKSSVNKLLKVSYNESLAEKETTILRRIGLVEYKNENKILKYINEKKPFIQGRFDLLESLFIKRTEFYHEEEVRLVIHKIIKFEDEIKGTIPENITLDIEINNFIDEVTFDPRLNENEFLNYSRILKKNGYKNVINQSLLYKFTRDVKM